MVRVIVRILTFIGGLYFILHFILPERWPFPGQPAGVQNPFVTYYPFAMDFIIIVGVMAFLLGPINLVRHHFVNLVRVQKGWIESIVFLVFLVIGITIRGIAGSDMSFSIYGIPVYNMLFNGLMFGFGASSMAMLAFYLISAAYRSFRLNSVDAALMMIAAVIVLLGQVPVGDWLTGRLPEAFQLGTASSWIFAVPNSAVQRAVVIGASGGAFAASLRHWLGLGRQQ